jgi:hypothetical protein
VEAINPRIDASAGFDIPDFGASIFGQGNYFYDPSIFACIARVILTPFFPNLHVVGVCVVHRFLPFSWPAP